MDHHDSLLLGRPDAGVVPGPPCGVSGGNGIGGEHGLPEFRGAIRGEHGCPPTAPRALLVRVPGPFGRTFYCASTVICTPGSLDQEVGPALGAQAGQRRITAVLREAGFSRVRLATQTPFSLILEARP